MLRCRRMFAAADSNVIIYNNNKTNCQNTKIYIFCSAARSKLAIKHDKLLARIFSQIFYWRRLNVCYTDSYFFVFIYIYLFCCFAGSQTTRQKTNEFEKCSFAGVRCTRTRLLLHFAVNNACGSSSWQCLFKTDLK